MPLFNVASNALENALHRGVAFTFPTSLKFKLSTTAPNTDGTNITEPSGGSYAAVTVTCNTGNFAAPSGAGGTNNTGTISFPTPTASWGTITHLVVTDQADNLLWYATLPTAKTPASGDPVEIAAAAYTFSLS
jgi:hypothetical protein